MAAESIDLMETRGITVGKLGRRESFISHRGSCFVGKEDVWNDEKFAKMFDRRLFLPGFVSSSIKNLSIKFNTRAAKV